MSGGVSKPEVHQVVTRGVWSGTWATHSNSKPVQNKKGCDASK